MKPPPPLKPHALEMLRLIGAAQGYWYPQDKSQGGEDAGGVFSVFVDGPETTGAIRTLTSRGLVTPIESVMGSTGPGKWARRITATGRALLDEHLAPLIEARKAARAAARLDARDDYDYKID